MNNVFEKVRKGPARTAARILRMDSNVANTKRAKRRKRALERLDRDIRMYQGLPPTRVYDTKGTTVAQKLERAQVARAFLMTKPGVSS